MPRLSKALIRRFALSFALLTLMFTSYGVMPQVEASPNPFESDDTAASRALGLVNEWRINEGLMPLELNGVLQQMAQAQAEFILPRLSSINEEELYHHDAKGRSAIARAIEVYDWPDFSLPQRVEVGENAAQFNVKGAVNFWQTSPIHKKTAMNPTYREVGIVALPLPQKGTYLFFMCFGARPNKLTALISGETLYVSREFSKYSAEKKVEPTIQLFDANRTPLTDPMPYTLKMPAPKNAGDKFFVKYKTSKGELWTEVQTTRDNAIVTDKPTTNVSAQLKAILAEEKVENQQATQTALAITPFDPVYTTPTGTTAVPTQVVVQAATQVKPQVTMPPTNTHAPTTVAKPVTPPPTNTRFPTPTSTATPQAVSAAATTAPSLVPTQQAVGQPDLIVSYSNKSLFVLNTTKKSLKLDGLKIGRLGIEAWTSVVKLPANGLPAGNCLEINIAGVTSDAPPAGCKHVWVAITVNPSRAFWTTDTFDVTMNSTTIRSCTPSSTTCEVKFP